jgi:hypothetical protein
VQIFKKIIMQESKFELVVDGIPYIVKVTPFQFNTETRYRVSYNGGEEHIFTWDSDLKRLWAIDEGASTMPDSLGMAISKKLESGNF